MTLLHAAAVLCCIVTALATTVTPGGTGVSNTTDTSTSDPLRWENIIIPCLLVCIVCIICCFLKDPIKRCIDDINNYIGFCRFKYNYGL